ncbi:unnamed protein product [Symbiodinium natans]|uniref:Uncharacterized protein n=1 Tax=Symbiodinium natans TaxID=878477 RepID=A0A812SZI1_9DINO|nr:unnamed protein product [Symbiodinium natans]
MAPIPRKPFGERQGPPAPHRFRQSQAEKVVLHAKTSPELPSVSLPLVTQNGTQGALVLVVPTSPRHRCRKCVRFAEELQVFWISEDVMPQQNPTSGLALLLLQRRYRQQLREADAPAQAAQQVACRLSSSAFACKAYFSRSSLTCKAC